MATEMTPPPSPRPWIVTLEVAPSGGRFTKRVPFAVSAQDAMERAVALPGGGHESNVRAVNASQVTAAGAGGEDGRTKSAMRAVLRRQDRGGHFASNRWTRHLVRRGDISLCGVLLVDTCEDGLGVQGAVTDCQRCIRLAALR